LSTSYTVRVAEHKAGTRLDKLLAESIPGLSRTRVKALIEDGRVVIGDAPAREPARRVKAGQEFSVTVPRSRPAVPRPQAIPLDVVFEDSDLIVIDKPAGMVVHPAPGHADGTLVNALLDHCRGSLSGIGGVTRPGIVHRLDKGTSGLMVAAKNDLAHWGLAEQFAEHSLTRAYFALLWGVPSPSRGEVTGNIGRHPRNRKKMAVVSPGGKWARTRYRLIEAFGNAASLTECRLDTGRTHQIRVHMASRGHPVVGDPLYGGGVRSRLEGGAADVVSTYLSAYNNQALHAYLIGFNHPRTGKPLEFESEVSPYFKELVSYFNRI
jgi:23S rRNA pseudouridine1911/1915/1917 synthase